MTPVEALWSIEVTNCQDLFSWRSDRWLLCDRVIGLIIADFCCIGSSREHLIDACRVCATDFDKPAELQFSIDVRTLHCMGSCTWSSYCTGVPITDSARIANVAGAIGREGLAAAGSRNRAARRLLWSSYTSDTLVMRARIQSA